MKKAIYHKKDEDKYNVVELEKTEQGEIYFRIKQGTKGEEKQGITLRVGFDELAGFAFRIEKMLLSDAGVAKIYHPKEENGYKVINLEKSEKGVFISFASGTKGDIDSRVSMAMRISEDELAGLFFHARKILLS